MRLTVLFDIDIMASSVAATAVPVPSSTILAAGSWPVEVPERQRHRIAFYKKYGVDLDPASPLSFTEQVRKAEMNETMTGKLFIRKTTYETLLSELQVGKGHNGSTYSIQQISSPGLADSKPTTETVLMRLTKGTTCRVLHSCNVFDVLADVHYKSHAAHGPTAQTLLHHTQTLRREVSMSDMDAIDFVEACPVCYPTSNVRHSIAPTVATSSSVSGATSSVTIAPPKPETVVVAVQAVAAPPAPRVVNIIDLTVPQTEGAEGRKRRIEWEDREVAGSLSRRFVNEVGALVDLIQQNDNSSVTDTVRSLPVHSLYQTVYRMLLKRLEFHKAGVPTKIDLGFHYTKLENMIHIRKSGLQVPSELHRTVSRNGARFGDGIYTASNPLAFHGKYGHIGIVVARLMGSNADYTSASHSHSNSGTVARNKLGEFSVVSTSDQCVALLEFDASQVSPNLFAHFGNWRLAKHQKYLQALLNGMINDPHYNGQAKLRNVRSKPNDTATANQVQNQAIQPGLSLFTPETLQYVAPISFLGQTLGLVGQFAVPVPFRDTWTCPLCHQACTTPHISQIKACEHAFHSGCLDQALGTNPSCPTCHARLGPPQGKMPSGTMVISRSTSTCSGYDHASTICIEYKILQACQHLYHPHPGVDHDGVNRRAYLPETPEGCSVLKRLKFC